MLPPLFGAALALLFTTVASPAAADEPEPTRRYADDRHPPPGTRLNLVLAGAAVTGLFYAPALASSFIWPDSPGASDLQFPVIGPWMKIGQTKLCGNRIPRDDSCNDFAVVAGAVLLALDGLGQAGGVGLIVESLFFRSEPESAVSVGSARFRSTAFSSSAKRSPYLWNVPGLEMSPVPLVGDGSDLGLALTGRF